MSITSSDRYGALRAWLRWVALAGALTVAPVHAALLRFDTLDEMAPDFAVAPEKMLSSLQGGWVLLHFWATWCEPCRVELPALERLYNRRGDRKITFVTVAMDDADPARVEKFLDQFGIRLPFVLQQDVHADPAYTEWGLPVTYIIAPDGRIVARALGPRDWGSSAVEEMLDNLRMQ